MHRWRRNDCDIYVVPEGVHGTDGPRNDPRVEWDPWPAFNGIRGPSLLLHVWSNGRWLRDGPWKELVSQELANLERRTNAARTAAEQAMTIQKFQNLAEQVLLERRASKAVAGAPRLVRWGGLDFNTTELDVELRQALALAFPTTGHVAQLAETARVADALLAARQDVPDEDDASAAQHHLLAALELLSAVQHRLLAANAELVKAQAALGMTG